MAKDTFQPDTLAPHSFAARSLRGVAAGGGGYSDSSALAAKLLMARRPERKRREEPEQERPVAPAIVARGEALVSLWAEGRVKVKRPAKPRKRKATQVAEAVCVPPPVLVPVECRGAALFGAEVLIECAWYDWERIRREDLALLGMV